MRKNIVFPISLSRDVHLNMHKSPFTCDDCVTRLNSGLGGDDKCTVTFTARVFYGTHALNLAVVNKAR